jgi:hypothetical protein
VYAVENPPVNQFEPLKVTAGNPLMAFEVYVGDPDDAVV